MASSSGNKPAQTKSAMVKPNNNCWGLAFLLTCMMVIQVTYMLFPHASKFTQLAMDSVITTGLIKGETKIILIWTKFGKAWAIRMGNCSCQPCEFIRERRRLKEAHAILFLAKDVHHRDLPSWRSTHQRWIWVNAESPISGTDALSPFNPHRRFHVPSRIFNWTMTYHSKSEVMESYGGLSPLNTSTVALRAGLLKTRGEPYASYIKALNSSNVTEEEMAMANRDSVVAWVVSHCHTNSRREDYVKILKKFVKVDIYGRCGPLRCGSRKQHRNTKCWAELFSKKYLFYLAFENSLCLEYVTEKLWNPLIYGLVPVVFGGADYSRILPPHSYINAMQLKPKELAELLLELRNSPKLYARYHMWRRYWSANLRPPLCELCCRLHQDRSVRVQHDIPTWWKRVGKCKRPSGTWLTPK
ncbi:alpha-(1,3)-fucosyltransferase C-like [Oratosquilla oratoria]|uniref:alpha-(1,3)-fucosyltransferase C-like n=1 Tax=Oratosquilla oratoria TaxID=337810 RepID=UPI003F762445